MRRPLALRSVRHQTPLVIWGNTRKTALRVQFCLCKSSESIIGCILDAMFGHMQLAGSFGSKAAELKTVKRL